MNAYEFTRPEREVPLEYIVNPTKYDIEMVAHKIKTTVADEPEYKDSLDTFIKLTMSCDLEEAKYWTKLWMRDAIAYGLQTKNRDWQHKFLAAYDIYNSLD